MRTSLLLLLCISLVYLHAESTYQLSEAIQKKLVHVEISGARPDTSFHGESSSHTGPCMALQITNAGAEPLIINLEYGYRLEPEDSSLQTMVVTKTLSVKLSARQKKNYRLYAMCTQAHDGGPSPDAAFRLGKRFNGNLLNLAALIHQKNYQTDAAQNAVWCLTDNYNLGSIYSTDTAMMYALRRFVAKAKGIAEEKILAAEKYEAPEPVRTYSMRKVYSGTMSYRFSGTNKVMIALFDEANKMKRVYVNNETQREGEYTYNYEIGSDEMEEKKHYLRLFRNGKLEDEIAIVP